MPDPLAYRVCDGSGEDPHCQDSVPVSKLSWGDHDWYVGHSMFCCPRGHPPGPRGCPFPFKDERRRLRSEIDRRRRRRARAR